jgi:hypothetical protein
VPPPIFFRTYQVVVRYGGMAKKETRLAGVLGDGTLPVAECWRPCEGSDDADFYAFAAITTMLWRTSNLRILPIAVGCHTVTISITEWLGKEAQRRAVKAVVVNSGLQARIDGEPVFDGRRLIISGFDVQYGLRCRLALKCKNAAKRTGLGI